MTERQKLEAQRRKLKKEKRDLGTKLGTIALEVEPSDEQRTEALEAQRRIIAINGELDTCEAALDTLPGDKVEILSAEAQEQNELWRGANVGEVLQAAYTGGKVNGATAELQAELGLQANMIAIEQLRPRREDLAVTTAPSETEQDEEAPLLPIFSDGAANFLGVAQPTVDQGKAVYPIFGTKPTVGGPHTDSTDAPEDAQTISAEVVSPGRITTSARYRMTDAALFPQMETGIQDVLRAALSQANDQEVIDEIVAEVNQSTPDSGAAWTYANYLNNLAYLRVDGEYAGTVADVRLLMAPATYQDASPLYRTNNSEQNVLEKLQQITAGVRLSTLIAAVNGGKQDVLVRLGTRRDMVAPVWRGVELTVDRVSDVGKGEVVITAVMLAAYEVLRPAAFARINARHS